MRSLEDDHLITSQWSLESENKQVYTRNEDHLEVFQFKYWHNGSRVPHKSLLSGSISLCRTLNTCFLYHAPTDKYHLNDTFTWREQCRRELVVPVRYVCRSKYTHIRVCKYIYAIWENVYQGLRKAFVESVSALFHCISFHLFIFLSRSLV